MVTKLYEDIQYKKYSITITKTGAVVRDNSGVFVQEFPTEEEAKEFIDSITSED